MAALMVVTIRSVTARVSASVAPGGSSADMTIRDSSPGGMNPSRQQTDAGDRGREQHQADHERKIGA